MKTYDEQRESIIKGSRDVQKAAKQAVFALHRGDKTRASTLLQEAGMATILAFHFSSSDNLLVW